MNHHKINIAFEILLEQIEDAVNELNEEGARAFRGRAYDKARELIEDAEQISEFRDKANQMKGEWHEVLENKDSSYQDETGSLEISEMPRGLRTPEAAFYTPILQSAAANEKGMPVENIIAEVGKKMNKVLNEYDQEPLPSAPGLTRWQNTAYWCGNNLMNKGFLKSNASNTIWEITDAGHDMLKDSKSTRQSKPVSIPNGESKPTLPESLTEGDQTMERFS